MLDDARRAAERGESDNVWVDVAAMWQRDDDRVGGEQAAAEERWFDSGADPLLRGVRNGAWLDAQEFPPLSYAVPGLIPEGFTLFVGAPKIGKSWAVLDIALGLACGGVAFGRLRTGYPRPVLVCALEDSDRRMQDRARRLLDGAPIPPLFEYVTRIEPGEVVATIAAWFEYAAHTGGSPTVILDTLGKVMPPARAGESAYQRDYRIGSTLKRVVNEHAGAALIVNHHDRKASAEDFIDGVSGTHGLAGAADTTIVLQRARHETAGLVKVTGRDVPEGEYGVTLVGGIAWQLDGTDLADSARRASEVRAVAGLGEQSAQVLAYVNAHPEAVSPKDVSDALAFPDARRYLARLADAGRIEKPARGLYAPFRPVSQLSQVSQPSVRCDTWDTCDTPLGESD
jgi:hypothetical protein